MKLTFVIFCLFCFSLLSAQTQAEMNSIEANSFKQADRELNIVYKRILQEYKTNSLFINRLKDSQRIWIKFRDAELLVKYPDPESNMGSIHSMCVSNYLEYLTRERIKTLRVWLTGVEEGDVCSGSVKLK
ncbi:MAG: lysozyme inhibitor LprI family protein [Bacteroidales bacterium]